MRIFEFRLRILNTEYYNQRIVSCASWDEYEKILKDKNYNDSVDDTFQEGSKYRYSLGSPGACDRAYYCHVGKDAYMVYATDLERLLKETKSVNELIVKEWSYENL